MSSLLSKGSDAKINSSYFSLFRTLKGTQSWLILFCGVILAIAAGAPLPIIGVIFAKIIDVFPPSEHDVQSRINQLLGVATAYLFVTWGWAFCWGVIGARISRSLRTQMVERALGLDQTYYETQCPDITSRLTVDAQIVQAGTAEKVGFFIQSCSYFVVSFIVGFILNARLTGILIAAIIPPMALVVITSTFVLNRFSKEAAESTSCAASVAEGAIRAVEVVQAFDAFDVLTKDHHSHLDHAMKVGTRKALTSAVLLGSIFFIAYAANALAFWEGSRIIRSSNASGGGAGTVYAIVFLILDASFVIGQAGPFIQSFHNAASAGSRILRLINYPKIPIDVYSEDGILADADKFGPGKEVEFKAVSFAYPARPTEKVLDCVDFKLKMGSSVGIVGSSGSGKSTIAALMLRLYDPTEGSILVDGHELSAFNLASVRNQVAFVDQDPAVFSGTVYSNIRHGYKGLPLPEDEMRGQCVKAAKEADAWSFIKGLPKGLDTWLGEPSGTRLSGGQKQRLCLARALVGKPTMLVLDEATSALDTISEATILSNLSRSRSMGHQSTIMIAHRLASVRAADQIIVMEKGHIIEHGTHESLMSAENGTYRQLVEAQQFTSGNTSRSSISTGTERTLVGREGSSIVQETPSAIAKVELKPENTYGTFAIIRRCLALSRSRLFFSILALLGSFVTGSLILGESIIFGHLITLINGSVAEGQVNVFCLMFFVISLAAMAGYITSGSCFGLVSEHLIMQTRDLSLRNVLRQDMEWFLQPGRSVSTLTSVISMDAGHISGLSGVIIGTIVSALVSVTGGAILGLVVAWRIALVLLATSPIVMLAGFFRLRVLARVEEKCQEAYTDAASLATEACSNIRTVAALSLEADVSERFHAAIDKNEKQTFRFTVLGNLLLAFALSVTYYVYSLAYWWGSKQVREGKCTTQQFFIVLPAILFSAQAAGQIFSLAPDIGRARGAAARVFALHDQKPTIDTRPTDGSYEKSRTIQNNEAPKGSGNIRFENVNLAYQSRPSAPIFTNLNLNIKSGEVVALVGRSGAGKSSTISLIERFYDPTGGKIYLDGVDIKIIPVAQHRARISLVSQDPDLFGGSIAFNVGLGAKPGHIASREEIEDACKAVGIHDFISSLADGYETQCGTNGSQLSGGQKQRIAIARAYIRNPEVLLLDEATSALDSNSEAQIQQAIMAVARRRTVVMIAHRLKTVQHADRILVFDDGKIVEEGKHDDLVRNGGIYEMMIRAQDLG